LDYGSLTKRAVIWPWISFTAQLDRARGSELFAATEEIGNTILTYKGTYGTSMQTKPA
jgi:hypothetical protein